MIESFTTSQVPITLNCPSCSALFTVTPASSVSGRPWWQIFVCQNKKCGQNVLVEFAHREREILSEGRVAYPYTKAATMEGVPEKVSFNYDQAVRSFSAGAYNAATVMSRASVEALAQDKKAEGKTLHDKIKWLYEQRIISPMLHDWAYSIKEWGNDAVHDLNPIDADTSGYIVKFAWELIEHLYIKPQQFGKIHREPRK